MGYANFKWFSLIEELGKCEDKPPINQIASTVMNLLTSNWFSTEFTIFEIIYVGWFFFGKEGNKTVMWQ